MNIVPTLASNDGTIADLIRLFLSRANVPPGEWANKEALLNELATRVLNRYAPDAWSHHIIIPR